MDVLQEKRRYVLIKQFSGSASGNRSDEIVIFPEHQRHSKALGSVYHKQYHYQSLISPESVTNL